MKELCLAGGEPFLYPDFLGSLVDHCKQELQLETVSIETDGIVVTREFLKDHTRNIDTLIVLCDSFDEEINWAIRGIHRDQLSKLHEIATWCDEFRIRLNIKTVVCQLNVDDDMNDHISELRPYRWECSQIPMNARQTLPARTRRDVSRFAVSIDEYEAFCHRHQQQPSFASERDRTISKSSLILNEYMSFVNRDGLEISPPILEIGVEGALWAAYLALGTD